MLKNMTKFKKKKTFGYFKSIYCNRSFCLVTFFHLVIHKNRCTMRSKLGNIIWKTGFFRYSMLFEIRIKYLETNMNLLLMQNLKFFQKKYQLFTNSVSSELGWRSMKNRQFPLTDPIGSILLFTHIFFT